MKTQRNSTAHVTHPLWLSLLTTLWLVTLPNWPLWRQLMALPEVQGTRGLLFALGMGVAIWAITLMLTLMLGWPRLLKPVLSLLVISAAAGAYFMLSYGIVIDATMITNVMQTDPREAADLLNWRMIVALLVLAVLPLWLIWRTPLRKLGWRRALVSQLGAMVVSALVAFLCLMAIFQDFASIMRNHTQIRYLINPLNSLYAVTSVAVQPFRRDEKTILPIGQDAIQQRPANAQAPLIVLVVGETARMGNFGINGYERPTTPKLAQEKVVSLRGVTSCGTSTAASLPCMFSHLGREDFDSRKHNYENLLDVLQRAGLAVLWVDNQAGCKGLCDRVHSASTTQLKTSPWCDGSECHDEVMLDKIDERLAQLPAEQRAKGVVLVMHQMGSHGPAYYKRTPAAFKKFLPECTSNALQECERQQVINAFDNTIVYTDHFLSQTIGWLKQHKQPSVMMYVSDHGESLGENNVYLHGLPYRIAPEEQKRVPWITWMSDSYQQQQGLPLECMRSKLTQPFTHDAYFHSALGLANVKTTLYQAELDLYASCRRS
ncbi:MAG: Phosphoethanolamine transferase EptA [Pseudomonadota bacterium]|jgi:lipid A ethanolaminephosphotransferase